MQAYHDLNVARGNKIDALAEKMHLLFIILNAASQPIKIRLKKPVLYDSVFFKLTLLQIPLQSQWSLSRHSLIYPFH